MPSADQPNVALEAPANGGAFSRTSGGYIGQFDSFRVIACCAVVLQHSLLWTIARVGGRGLESDRGRAAQCEQVRRCRRCAGRRSGPDDDEDG